MIQSDGHNLREAWKDTVEMVRSRRAVERVDSNIQVELADVSLHSLAWQGNLEKVKNLLADEEADPNFQDEKQNTPLHVATIVNVDAPEKHFVKEFVKNPIKKLRKISNTNAPLQHAQTQTEVEKSITQQRENYFEKWGPAGEEKNRIEVIKVLLNDERTDVNLKNLNNETPIDIAHRHGNAAALNVYFRDIKLSLDFKFTSGNLLEAVKKANVNKTFSKLDDGTYAIDKLWKYETFQFLTFLKECLFRKDTKNGDFLFRDSEVFMDYLGSDENMFHLRKIQGISMLEYIKDHGKTMTKERELLIDLLVLIADLQKWNSPEGMIIDLMKSELPSTPWLKNTIKNVQDRFSWTLQKALIMIFVAFLVNIIFGWGSYILDVYTDIRFVYDMAKNSNNFNYDISIEACQPQLTKHVQKIQEDCQWRFEVQRCVKSLKGAVTVAETCFEKEQRFI